MECNAFVELVTVSVIPVTILSLILDVRVIDFYDCNFEWFHANLIIFSSSVAIVNILTPTIQTPLKEIQTGVLFYRY